MYLSPLVETQHGWSLNEKKKESFSEKKTTTQKHDTLSWLTEVVWGHLGVHESGSDAELLISTEQQYFHSVTLKIFLLKKLNVLLQVAYILVSDNHQTCINENMNGQF